jgi:5-dehydro-4-deoxyglucarate dehydratase
MTMSPTELKARLRGVIAFAPTPFTADDRVDFDGLACQVDFLVKSGVDVVVVAGGVGEFHSLTIAEYRDLIQTGVAAVGGRVPVLAGIGHGAGIARDLAEHAAKVGAAGLMINPFYFVEPAAEGRVQHYADLGRAAGLGMMIFSTRGAVHSPDLVARLAEVDEVIALKDEYGDLALFLETKLRLGDRLAWVNGMAEVLAAPYGAAGATAFTSGLVNFAPAFSLAIRAAVDAADWPEVNRLVTTTIQPLARLRAKQPGYMVAVIKEAMNLLGLPGGAVRSPLLPVASADRDELRDTLRRLDLLAA